MNRQKGSRAQLSAEHVGVIIGGFPQQAAVDVAKACAKRGYNVLKFGLATQDAKLDSLEVPDVGKFQLCKFSDAKVKQKLQEAISHARKQHLSVVMVDTTNLSENVSLYNELQVPFILQSKGGESHVKAVRDTEEAKTFALISEQMNKRAAVFDEMWRDWSMRFPGMFDDSDFFLRSTNPLTTSRSLLNSLSDLTNKPLGLENVQPFDSEEKSADYTEGQASQEYTFKNGSGSSTFTFRHTINNNQEYAESVADSVGFLAQKSQEIARPQVYNMLDVARSQPRLTMW